MKNPKNKTKPSVSRRSFIKSTGVLTSGICLAGLSTSLSCSEGQTGKNQSTIKKELERPTARDHFWIFSDPAGTDDKRMEKFNVLGGSRMTPAEGAFWLDVPNLLLIRDADLPPYPDTEKWRTKTSYQQYAISFQPLDRVVWSIIGSGGAGNMKELDYVLTLAEEFPNISGIYLDDFIIDYKKLDNGRRIGRPAISPDELKVVREKFKTIGHPMEIWVTLYPGYLHPDDPKGYGCDPPLSSFIDLFDVLTLWIGNSEDLRNLGTSLVELETVAPKSARIAIGVYTWEYGKGKDVPLDLLEYQCELGLKWLKEKRIHEMIFMGNTLFDMGFPSSEFVRKWIAKVGNQTL